MGTKYDIGEMIVPAGALGAVGYAMARAFGGRRAGMSGALVGAALGAAGVAATQAAATSMPNSKALGMVGKALSRVDLTRDEAALAESAAPTE